MSEYFKMKEELQKKINEFPMFFAFSNKQFSEGMVKLGLKPTDTDKVIRTPGGGIIRKEDKQKFADIFEEHEVKMNEKINSDDQFVQDMFTYELNNHEYIITYDVEDTLEALGMTYEEVQNNERLKNILDKSCKILIDSYSGFYK